MELGSKFSRLLAVYLLWLGSWILTGSLFEVYFFNMGMSFQEIFLADTLIFVASMFTIPFLKGFKARDSMVMGISVSFICAALLFLFPTPGIANIFRLLVGLTHVLFWIPFNTLYYEFRKENNALMGALYYSLSPVLSLALPALGGLVVVSMGFPALYALAMVSFAITGVAAWVLVENQEHKCDFIKSLRSISGLRSMIFLEGFSAAVIIGVTLAIMPLSYITKPLEFGIFLSLATIFSVAATLVTAKLSDKVRRRREFILPVVLAFGISAILASQANDLMTFFLGIGLVNFFSRIFFPLPLALAVDNSKSILESMVGREFVLNFGRLCGCLLGYAVLLNTDIRYVLLLQGVAMLLYIPLFENRKRKLERH